MDGDTRMSPQAIDDAELRKVGAERRLAEYREKQTIIEAALAGRSQTAIAQLVGVSQPHVSRMITMIRIQNHGELKTLPTTPLVLIDLRDAGRIDTETMMQRLLDLDYTDGYVPEVNGVATDAYERGSWDDIEYAFQQNRLSFEEYSQLLEAHRAKQRDSARAAWR